MEKNTQEVKAVQVKKGVISSTKTPKMLVVRVDTYKTHPKYKKRYKITRKFYAHYDEGTYTEGQMVTIQETRPMSALKRWKVVS